jgi:hypothetical protein
MNDYVEYLNALQASSVVAQMGDQKQQEIIQNAQQGIMDKILPTEELSQIPGLATGGLAGVLSVAKNVGESFIKESLKTQMKNLGIDDDTISSVLKGDLNEAMSSKVGSILSNVKGTVSDGVNTAKGVLQDAVDTASSTVDSAITQARNTLSNGIDSVQSSISQAEGISSDLVAQAQQEFQSISSVSLADYDQGSLFSRAINSYAPTINEPQSIEMTTFAAPDIAPEVSSTISGALSDVESGVSGVAGLISDTASQASSAISSAASMLSGVGTDAVVAGTAAAEAAGEAVGDTVLGAIGAASSFLGPLGIFAGLIGGIVGAVEMHRDEARAEDITTPPEPILNPSAQFL